MQYLMALMVTILPVLAFILMFLGVPCLVLAIKALKKYLKS